MSIPVMQQKDLESLSEKELRSIIAEYHEVLRNQHSTIHMQAKTIKDQAATIGGQGLMMVHLIDTYCEGRLEITDKTIGMIKREMHIVHDTMRKMSILRTVQKTNFH